MKLVVRLLWYLVELWVWDHPTYQSIEHDKLKQKVEDFLKERE